MREAMAVVITILSIAIVVLVLVQSKGADLGGFLGGSSDGGVQRTRRGIEAVLYNVTIYVGVAFFVFVLIGFFVWGG